MRLSVRKLSRETTEPDVRDLFESFGAVQQRCCSGRFLVVHGS